ncbi:hypothetical protein TNCV_4423391 [Trichonephila clavipes]|nr:hypothetical protein TNCV_4423391 [Trichonephila clavipes]
MATVPNSVCLIWCSEVHEQMFQSVRWSVSREPTSVKFPSKLGTHLSTHWIDERLNQPFPARGLNLEPVAWKRDALAT